MRAHTLQDVVNQLEQALQAKDLPAVESLLWPALDQKPEIAVLWHCAGAFFQLSSRHALADICWTRAQELETNPSMWNNRGTALKCMSRPVEARRCYEMGLLALPDDANLLANLCGSYVNEGDPAPGIEAGERALKAGCADAGVFNLALLHLEAGNYGRGFDLYAEGKHQHREERDYAQAGEAEPAKLTPEVHASMRGQGKRLVVAGEQGIGDELMMATMLRDVIADYEVVFDCHPRLESLHQHADWVKILRKAGRPVTILPTRKMRGDVVDRALPYPVDLKVSLGDLGRLYRRESSDFKWHGPVYRPDPREAREMRSQLSAIANGRRIVGLATRGGTISTNVHYRTLKNSDLEQILSTPDTLFVGLDYDDMTALQHPNYFWSAAVNFAWDYEHVGALIAATDAVLTICQSVAHLSAAMGHETHVLVPDKPAWRYGPTGERWQWYPGAHATLHRGEGNVERALAALCSRRAVAA